MAREVNTYKIGTKRNTQFQCDNAWYDGLYAHNVYVAIPDAVWWLRRPLGTKQLYIYQRYDWPFHRNLCIFPWVFDFFRWWYYHDSKYICIILADMKQSQPQITLYHADIFLGWCGKILRSIESLMMILLSASLASLIPLPSDGITIILWSYCTYTYDKTVGTKCVSELPLIETLRQSFAIGDCTTWGCCRI